MTPNRRLLGATGLALLSLSLSACIGSSGEGSEKEGETADVVISYNTPEEWANWGAVLEAFTEESGIDAPNDPKNSGQALAALEAEASAPAADVAYFGLVFGLQADDKGLLAGYGSDAVDEVPDDLKSSDGTWVTVHQGAIAFLVNTDALGGAPVPECWDDLTKPEYKDMVGFLDPNSAAVGYSVVAAANSALGGSPEDWEPGLAWAKKLKDNGLALPAQTATSAVQQGEIPILIDADFNGYKLAEVDGAPVEVVLPCEGTISVPYVMGLVKDAPHPSAGKELLDFVLSDEAQQLFAESYLRPVRDVALPEDVAAAMASPEDYAELVQTPDFQALAGAMESFLARWNDEVM
jgi:putative spermidine/putrescine transport system substrate-binding protein